MKSNTYYFLLLFIISFLFRLTFVFIFQFDGLYGQDAYAYYDYSKIFHDSVLSFHIPPNFYWPIGYYLFTSIFSIFTAGNIGYAAMLVSLNAGSLCAGVVFLITYELLKENYEETERKKISLYAGLIFCFSGVVVKSSIVIMSDALGLLFASLSMLYLLKFNNGQKLSCILLAFTWLALAIMTRYAYLILLIPFGIILIYIIRKSPYNRATNLKHYIFGLICSLLVFLPQLYYIAKFGIAYVPSQPEERTWVVEWSPANFLAKDFFTKDGVMHNKIWNALYYLSPIFHPLYLSVFGLTFVYGFLTLLRKKQCLITLFCLFWIIFFYVYLAGSPYQSLRYTLAFLPALVIISAIGLGTLNVRNVFRRSFLYAGITALVVFDVYHLKGFAEQKQDELKIVNWVNNNIADGSQIFSFEITPALKHYSKIKPHEFYLLKQHELKSMIDSSNANEYFILPEDKLNTQWKALPIEQNFQFLKSNYKLIPVAELNYYKVYKLIK